MVPNVTIGDSTVIDNSTIHFACEGSYSDDPREAFRMKQSLRDYTRRRPEAKIGNKVVVKGSEIYFHYLAYGTNLGDQARVINSKITNANLGKNTLVQNSSILSNLNISKMGMHGTSYVMLEDQVQLSRVQLLSREKADQAILFRKGSHIANIGKTELAFESSAALQVGGLALGIATMGLGLLAVAMTDKSTGKLIFAENGRIDGKGRSACAKGSFVSYGGKLGGNLVSSMADLRENCTNQ
jgi:hypothetical protein